MYAVDGNAVLLVINRRFLQEFLELPEIGARWRSSGMTET